MVFPRSGLATKEIVQCDLIKERLNSTQFKHHPRCNHQYTALPIIPLYLRLVVYFHSTPQMTDDEADYGSQMTSCCKQQPQ